MDPSDTVENTRPASLECTHRVPKIMPGLLAGDNNEPDRINHLLHLALDNDKQACAEIRSLAFEQGQDEYRAMGNDVDHAALLVINHSSDSLRLYVAWHHIKKRTDIQQPRYENRLALAGPSWTLGNTMSSVGNVLQCMQLIHAMGR